MRGVAGGYWSLVTDFTSSMICWQRSRDILVFVPTVGRVAFEVDGGGVLAEGLHTPRLRFLFLLISSSSSMVSYFGSARSCISSSE